MPFVPGQDVMQVEVIYSLFGITLENNLYFRHQSGSINQGAADILDNALTTWLGAKLLPNLSNDVTVTELYMTDLTSSIAPTYSYTKTLPGGATGASLPGGDSICVSFRSAGRGRSSRGRNYVSGLRETDVIGNKLNAVPYNAIRTAYTDLITDAGISGWDWGVFSRYSNGLPRVTGFFQPINQVKIVDQVLDSQRNRTR